MGIIFSPPQFFCTGIVVYFYSWTVNVWFITRKWFEWLPCLISNVSFCTELFAI